MTLGLWAFCVNLPLGNKINFHFQAKSRLCWDPCNGRACAQRAAKWGFHLWDVSYACVSYSYPCHLLLWNSPLSPNNISFLFLLLSLDTGYEAMSRRAVIASPLRGQPLRYGSHPPCACWTPYLRILAAVCKRSWQSQTLPLGLQKAFRTGVTQGAQPALFKVQT